MCAIIIRKGKDKILLLVCFLLQDKLCLPHHILEERGLVKVGVTVQALLDLSSSKPTQTSTM